jgi:micrococcal nuclease
MSKRKLSSLLFTLIAVLIITVLQKNNPQFLQKTIQEISPTPLQLISQKDTVLGATDSAHTKQMVKVIKVIDGDTLEIEGGQKVRYIGIDTPETKHPTKGVQCFGKQAFEKNKELVEGKEVIMEKDVSETDRYGRLLRFIYVDGVFINDYLVRQGYAHAITFPPDVKLADQFKAAEQEARENNRGLWSLCLR